MAEKKEKPLTRLGKYELLEFLGSGATAEVYHARDTVLDREVALKVLKPALVVDGDAFARFTQEARFAAKLFHDAIATVLDMREAGERDGCIIQPIGLLSTVKDDYPFNVKKHVRASFCRQPGARTAFSGA
jgi:serine/threonine protein kinase